VWNDYTLGLSASPLGFIIATSILNQTQPEADGLFSFLNKLNPIWAVVIWIVVFVVAPFIRDKIWPEVAESRKRAAEKIDKATDRQIHMQEKFIESLHSIQTGMAALAQQMEHMGDTFHTAEIERSQARALEARAILEGLNIIKEDIAAVYGKIDAPRPSRQRGS
jgi:hypothetical protein